MAAASRGFVAALLLFAGPLLAHIACAEHWAVIVAGSRGFDNYRHQADACHAYHVVRRHGIPAENVVLMMYDDVANATENPFHGKLFNKPAYASAVDVYAGCEIDYKGEDVTPEHFLAVLLGDAKAAGGKKVLASGPDDRVFVNFVDHGARGFVVFPHGQMLTASQLTGTLEKIYAQKKYKELVLYVEACHSGSMFWSWSMSRINAYVTTAANGWESSWGTYCPPMDFVDGVALGTCLGDLYSVNWMEDSDRTDLSSESLQQQFKIIKKKTDKSHAEQFGSSRVRREIVGDFLSNYDLTEAETARDGVDIEDITSSREAQATVSSSSVDAHDIPLLLAFYRYLRSPVDQTRRNSARQLMDEIDARQQADRTFDAILRTYSDLYAQELPTAETSQVPTQCTQRVFGVFAQLMATSPYPPYASDLPAGFTSYSLQYAGVLLDLCAALGDADRAEKVLACAVVGDRCVDSSAQRQEVA